jgi:hypothetical protein
MGARGKSLRLLERGRGGKRRGGEEEGTKSETKRACIEPVIEAQGYEGPDATVPHAVLWMGRGTYVEL